MLGADVKDEKLAIDGWQVKTDLEILPFLQNYSSAACGRFSARCFKRRAFRRAATELYTRILLQLPN